jgi:hypothetical protein
MEEEFSRVWVQKPEGKRQIGNPKCRWECIKMGLKENT